MKTTEAEITDKIVQEVKALFEDKRFMKILSANEFKRQEVSADNQRADFEMNVKLKNGKKYRIVLKSNRSVSRAMCVQRSINCNPTSITVKIPMAL